MDNFRFLLLIIGCLFVLGIYLWEVFFKSEPRKGNDMLDAVDDFPNAYDDTEISAPSIQKTQRDDHFADIADLGSLLAKSKNEINAAAGTMERVNTQDNSAVTISPKENDNPTEIEQEQISDKPLPLEMSVKDYEAVMADEDKNTDALAYIDEHTELDELDLDSEADLIEEDQDDEQNIPESNQSSSDILVLYITSPKQTVFNGLLISKAADEVGMIYGHMNIFHHFGPGKLHSGQPLFSMANMYEPGSFDLGKMAELKTKGISIFMYSPASIDASVVFELFLNTTQRIAELLGGEIRTAKNELLTNAEIKILRDKAESL